MSNSTVSRLAQKLAESHDVDLTDVQATSPEGKITARNVLDFLNLTAEEEAVLKRQSERKSDKNLIKTAEFDNSPKAVLVKRDQAAERSATEPVETQRDSTPAAQVEGEPGTPTLHKGGGLGGAKSDPALSQTRAQLQATALVHQKAVMQVGALKHQNEALDYEIARLKSKEASAQAFIQELEQKKLELEQELEKSQKRPSRFAWLRKRVF